MKKYIKPAANVLDINLANYLGDPGGENTIVVTTPELGKGASDWELEEDEVEDDDWW